MQRQEAALMCINPLLPSIKRSDLQINDFHRDGRHTSELRCEATQSGNASGCLPELLRIVHIKLSMSDAPTKCLNFCLAENLCPPIHDLTSWPPFSAWLLHQRLGRWGQHTRLPWWYLIETAVEDRTVNTQFETAWEPGKQAWVEDSIKPTTSLSVRNCADFLAAWTQCLCLHW